MQNILIMANRLHGGGAEKVLSTFLNHLPRDDIKVTLCSIFEEDNQFIYSSIERKYIIRSADHLNPIKSAIINILNKARWKAVLILPARLGYKTIFHQKFDVEIAFIEGESTKIISASPNKNSKKIAWVHIDLEKNPWTDFLYKSVEDEAAHYDKFDQIVCVSEDVRKAFLSKYKLSEEKVLVIYNPVDEKDILQKGTEQIDLYPHTLQFVTLGRLENQKGYIRLIDCIAKLRDENIICYMWILGEGSQKAELQEKIRRYRLEDQVQLLGFQSNPYKYIARADAFVCSSYAEGFSTAATECLILGKPIFTTECAGMRELFGNNDCGVITENSEEGIYQMLKTAILEPDAMQRYREGCLQRREDFQMEKSVAEIRALWEK